MASSEKTKALHEKHQRILADMLRKEENRFCADCGSRGPRWASWNLGVFLCIRCAGIHRNLGVHLSRVKSVNLDSWTTEQIEAIERGGNQKAKDLYECNLPPNYRRPLDDYAVEQFIRGKYEYKTWVSSKKSVEEPKLTKVVEKKGEKKAVREKTAKTSTKVEQIKAVPRPTSSRNALCIPNAQPSRSSSAPQLVEDRPLVDLTGDDPPPFTQDTPLRSQTAIDTGPVPANMPLIENPSQSMLNPTPNHAHSQTGMAKDAIMSLYSAQPVVFNGTSYPNSPAYHYQQQQLAMIQAQQQMYCSQQQTQIAQVQEKMSKMRLRQQHNQSVANSQPSTMNPGLW